jgi:hypothetical protein
MTKRRSPPGQAALVSIFMLTLATTTAMAQQDQRKFRIAKIEVDSNYLEQYKAHPTRVTVFEVYASEEAYQAHLKTAHFLKYKNGTLNWVRSLELLDVAPIAIAIKPTFVNQDHH